MKIRQPSVREMRTGEVIATTKLSPTFVRITIAGEQFVDLDDMGLDYAFRLFFRRDGQSGLTMPTVSNNAWIAQYVLMPKSRRPWARNYTIRSMRPDKGEIDIDFALHGDAGPASTWAANAQPGEPAGVFPEGVYFLPPDGSRRLLLVGEESAVPAIMGILEGLGDDATGDAYLEVPDAGDEALAECPRPEGVELHWLVRDHSAEAIPGRRALDAASAAELPEGSLYAWVAGEQGLPSGLRRHLVSKGIQKSDIAFTGYWRHGKSSPG